MINIIIIYITNQRLAHIANKNNCINEYLYIIII